MDGDSGGGAGKAQYYYEDTSGFGSLTALGGSTGTPFKFGGGNGCQTDADTGLVLMGHRYYDSRIGRFISQDPAGDGNNWYAYCGNNPVNSTDPTGLQLEGGGPSPFESMAAGGAGSLGRNLAFLDNYSFQEDLIAKFKVNYEQDSGPSVWQDAASGALTGLSAVGSAASGGLWDGGNAKNDPSFAVSLALAEVGIAAGTAAFGGAGAAAKSACFTAGTPVQTDSGTKPIQDIQAGDLVATRDPQTGKTETRKVVRTFVHLAHETVTAQFADAGTGKAVETVTATPEHLFYVLGRGFAALGSLGVGTQVVTRAGPALVVASLVRHSDAAGVAVYNLEVEGDHTYFVGNTSGGVWVHNLCNAADIVGNAVVKGKIITFKQALDRIRGGLDVFAGKRSQAKALAKAASGINKAIGPEIHGAPADGFVDHFHPDPRSGSHIFFP